MNNQDSKKAVAVASNLVMKGLGIIEPEMRAAYVADKLAQMPDEMIVEVIRIIVLHAGKKEARFLDFLENGFDPIRLKKQLGRFKFSRVYHLANQNKYREVIALFSKARPARVDDGDDEMFQVYGMPDKTVGERRYLARQTDKLVMDKIGYDQNPLVIRELLLNPRLTEPEVLKIASRRPNTAEVLTEVFNNKKWLSRYQVKLALAANPYTPPAISLALVPFIIGADLRNLAFDQKVAKQVREEAFRIYNNSKSEESISG